MVPGYVDAWCVGTKATGSLDPARASAALPHSHPFTHPHPHTTCITFTVPPCARMDGNQSSKLTRKDDSAHALLGSCLLPTDVATFGRRCWFGTLAVRVAPAISVLYLAHHSPLTSASALLLFPFHTPPCMGSPCNRQLLPCSERAIRGHSTVETGLPTTRSRSALVSASSCPSTRSLEFHAWHRVGKALLCCGRLLC